MERQQGEKPRSEPDSGNPTVRDRRGACGNVGYGEKGRPLRYRKRVYGSIPPKVKRAVFLSRLAKVHALIRGGLSAMRDVAFLVRLPEGATGIQRSRHLLEGLLPEDEIRN